MSFTTPKKGSFAPATPQQTKPVLVLPPLGINQVDPLAQFPEQDAVFMYNMIAAEKGTRVRSGYREWCTNVGTGGVKTIIPYTGSSSLHDKVFAAAANAIYDVTLTSAAPTIAIAFPGATALSGQGIFTDYTTVGGFFCGYFDEEYGYYRYTEATNTWVRTTGAEVTGVNPNNLVFGMIYKSKLWMIEKGTSDAWYLPTGSIIGAATKFSFGNKFRRGGSLQALYNWTLDGGIGVDDYLIAVSSSGEVVIYKGNDPASDFNQVGAWFIGAVPVGRRVGGTFGGDLYLLSVYGLQPISKLISGQLSQTDTIELTRKVSPTIKSLMATLRTSFGWEVKFVPSEGALFVMSPDRVGFMNTQIVQSLNNQGWSVYQALPCYSGDTLNGQFYFGATNNTVYIHDGDLDAVNLAGSSSTLINSSVLGGFFDYSEPGQYHRAQFIRPVFLSPQQPKYSVEVRYDYNLSEVFSGTSGATPSGALWDIGIWDVSTWTGDFIEIERPVGGTGLGRAMAVGLTMQTGARTILIRHDLMFDTGNLGIG